MKVIFFFKKLKPGKALKDFIVGKLNKLVRFLPGEKENKEILIKVEIEQSKETEPKRGPFKTEIHYQPVGQPEINVSAQSKGVKMSFLKAFRKLKQTLLRLHHKVHQKT